MQEQIPLWRRVLRAALTAALSLLLVGVFYVAVVMGQPQSTPDDAAVPQEQPLPAPLTAAVRITNEEDFDRISEAFPAPVMRPMYGNALLFVEGSCTDTAFEGGVARIVTLTYRTETYDLLTITSVYPARALSLMGKGDYTFSDSAGPQLGTLRTVRMENGTSVRLHAQGEEALYIFTAPLVDAEVLKNWTGISLQLYTGGRSSQ